MNGYQKGRKRGEGEEGGGDGGGPERGSNCKSPGGRQFNAILHALPA